MMIFLFALMGVQLSYGASCGDVRLDRPGFIMHNKKIRTQEGMGICYAHVGAQLIDAWRSAHVPPQVKNNPKALREYEEFASSAIWLAVNHALNQKKISCPKETDKFVSYTQTRLVEAGFVCDGVQALKGPGSCDGNKIEEFLRKKYESENVPRMYTQDTPLSQLFDTIYSKEDLARYCREHPLRKDPAVPYCLRCEIPTLENPVTSQVDFWDVMHALKNEDIRSQALSTRFALERGPCKKGRDSLTRQIGRFPSCEKDVRNGVEDWEGTQARIISLLKQKNPQPVGVSFCSRFFTDPSRTANSADWEGVDFANLKRGSTPCDGHAALIVGSRTKNGKCQFLLRNSWGKKVSEDLYHKTWERDLASDGMPTGQVWLDADVFSKNIFEIETLK